MCRKCSAKVVKKTLEPRAKVRQTVMIERLPNSTTGQPVVELGSLSKYVTKFRTEAIDKTTHRPSCIAFGKTSVSYRVGFSR